MPDQEDNTEEHEQNDTLAEALSARIYEVASGSYADVEPTQPSGYRTPEPHDQIVEQHSQRPARTGNTHHRIWIGHGAAVLPRGIERLWVQTVSPPLEGLPEEAQVGWSIGGEDREITSVTIAPYDSLVAKVATDYYKGLLTKLTGPDGHGWGMMIVCKPETVQRVMGMHGVSEADATTIIMNNAPEQAWNVLDAASQLRRGSFVFGEPPTE